MACALQARRLSHLSASTTHSASLQQACVHHRLYPQTHRHTQLPCLYLPHSRSSIAAAAGSFNFADSGDSDRVGRRNRTVDKKKANEVVSLVKGLCTMSSKQLAAVSHLLSEKQLQELAVAVRIPPTNKGRRRQENLLAKLLRSEMDEAALTKLTTAVAMARSNNIPYVDQEVEQQLNEWIEGLARNDAEVTAEVLQICQDSGLDWSTIRSWARQLEQQQEVAAAAAAAVAATAADAGPPATAGGPDEPQGLGWQEVKEEQQQKQQQVAAERAAQRAAQSTRNSLRKALRPLAIARLSAA